MLKAVFLDVGGVFHLPAEELVRAALRSVGFELPPNVLTRAHYAGMAGHDRFDGNHEEVMEPYVEEMVRDLAVPEGQASGARSALFAALTSPGAWAGTLSESIDQLPALAATGVAIGIVSNADGTVEARLREESICQVGPGPGVPVTIVVDSAVAGVRKPDPRIWAPALAATGARPEEAIHVGDSLITDVGGAVAAGIRPLHFDPFRLCRLDDHPHAASMGEVVELVRAELR
jgi:putative hydrolase of the HAD superfamily